MNKSVNTIRFLSMDEINKAKSGHPGVVLGFAPVAYTLFHDFLKITPKCSKWFDRDRFVLASGHASSMLYSLLHLCGYKITMDDLKNFRHLGSITPGHPEVDVTDGLDSSSGPLGQGIAMACGMAIAEDMLAKRFNKEDIKLIDHYTFVECGDGDLQEGVTLEALSLIGHLKLNKLIILFDSNKIQLDGPVSNAGGINNSKEYFKALGFNYLEVKDPENLEEGKKAIKKAKKSELPSIVECHTTIGYGSALAGTSKCHGAPLGVDMTNELRKTLEYSNKEFEVDEDVYQDFKKAMSKNTRTYNKWKQALKEYSLKYKEDYEVFKKVLNNDYLVPEEVFNAVERKEQATRNAIGQIINKVSEYNKVFIAGSADLTASTYVKGVEGSYTKETPLGRNINYGVREHAMGAIANGMTLHNVRNMTGAFFVFSDYMKPAIRMAAIMKCPTIFGFSHDSVAVGEDGPTHEPIEQLAGLRAIPNVQVFRPSDTSTTAKAMELALATTNKPSVILLTRQALPVLEEVPMKEFKKGAYYRYKAKNAKGTLVASGSEVALALNAKDVLKNEGIDVNVVEVVSTNLFDLQGKEYKEALIPSNMPSMFVEMDSSFGLHKYTKEVYALDRFGTSGNIKDLIEYFGFTKEKVAEAFKNIM